MRKKNTPEVEQLGLPITVTETQDPVQHLESSEIKITDEELNDFKAWKESKAKKVEIAPSREDKARQMWKEESRLVKGIFRCHEPAGGSVEFSFRKYKWDPTRKYTMHDGQVYEVPLAVARHLNQNCNYQVHSHVLDAEGRQTVDRNKVKSRMNFESTEFSFV
jgi:hypothetical protein